jgi:hypothetical protein
VRVRKRARERVRARVRVRVRAWRGVENGRKQDERENENRFLFVDANCMV